ARSAYASGLNKKATSPTQPPHLQALLSLVEFVAKAVERETERQWHENRFTGQYLTKVLGLVMADPGLVPNADDAVPSEIEKAEDFAGGLSAWFRFLPEEPDPSLPEAEFVKDFRNIKRTLKRRHK